MTEAQGWVVIALLAVIAASLYPLTRTIERFIRVVIHQREQIERAIQRTIDDPTRRDLREILPALQFYLDASNNDRRGEVGRRIDEMVAGIRARQSPDQ